MTHVTLLIAFFGGILTFLSPCILPLIPGFLAYIAGSNIHDAPTKPSRKQLFLVSLFFVIGFSLVFSSLGLVLNLISNSLSVTVNTWLARIGGLIIIFFGLHMLNIIKIPALHQEKKIHINKKMKNMYLSALVFGVAFAIGWSPCIGSILGGIFALTLTQPGIAFGLLLAYAIGLGVPFLIVGFFSSEAMQLIRKSHKFLKYFNLIVGILLLILGITVFFDKLNVIAYFWIYI